MDKTAYPTARSERCGLIVYLIIATVVLILIVLLQSSKHGIFGTTLLLGWDTPSYVWTARYIITKGPIHMIKAWGYPYFYTPILAFFGYLTGNLVMVERILPMLFGILLIWANSELVFRITNKFHIAGSAAILSAISLNILRILSDLHRNLMAFSLSMIALLLVPYLEERRSFRDRRYLSFILLLFVIAITQFETFFILSVSLVFYGIFTKNRKKLLKFTLACVIPAAILVSLFPSFFSGYMSSFVYFESERSVNLQPLWVSGSWILLCFSIVGCFLFYRSEIPKRKSFSLVFSWSLVILILISLIGTRIASLPIDFAYRSVLILPIPVLLALTVEGCNNTLRHHELPHTSSFTRKIQSFPATLRRLLPFVIAFFLIGCSGLLTIQFVDSFLTPFVPRSGYEKILEARQFLVNNSWPTPIFIFRGDQSVQYVNLYRYYLGAEIGEHFAYYGDLENLLQLVPSEPKIDYDNYLSQLEEYYLVFYYLELIGNMSGPPPPMYVHDSHISTVEELMSHSIVIITPEFYDQEIPNYLQRFHVGEGIYAIPPYSATNSSEITSNPKVKNPIMRCV